MVKHSGKPPGDDAWAGLNESDEWGADKTPPPFERPTGESAPAATHRPSRPSKDFERRFVLEGQTQKGDKVVLELTRFSQVLGRSSRCQLILADSSVSREHARLELVDGSRIKITDLKSGNGTFVGQKRIDEAFLAHGDEVVVGHVPLRLVDLEGPALPPASPGELAVGGMSGPQRAPFTSRGGLQGSKLAQGATAPGFYSRWMLLAVLVLVLGAGGGFWHNRNIRQLAVSHCQAGLKAFNAGRWDKAEQSFAAALTAVPHHPLAKRYSDAVAKVRSDAQRLAEVAAERGASRFVEARELLRSVGTTPLLNEALAQAEALRASGDQIIEQAETAFEANLDAEGRAVLAKLGTPPPNRPDVSALNAWMGAKAELNPLTQRTKLRPRGLRPKTLLVVSETQPPAMRRAVLAFRRSRPEAAHDATAQALGRPTTPPEQELLRLTASFVRLWRTGMGEHRGKRAFAAIRLFTEARSLAERIAGDRSEPSRSCAEKLSDMYYVLGVMALGSDKLAEAAEALNTALSLTPSHALSRRKLSELELRAQRLVSEASLMQVTHVSRARELCRKVIEAMPAQSHAARQARALERHLRP